MLKEHLEPYLTMPAYFGLMEKFVLRNGKMFPRGKRPRGVHLGKLGQCYRNAALLALAGYGEYVEGFAMKSGLIPLQHAWIEIDGEAIDNTWRDADGTEYMGVTFSDDVLRRELLKNKVYGILEQRGRINRALIASIDRQLIVDAETALQQRVRA